MDVSTFLPSTTTTVAVTRPSTETTTIVDRNDSTTTSSSSTSSSMPISSSSPIVTTTNVDTTRSSTPSSESPSIHEKSLETNEASSSRLAKAFNLVNHVGPSKETNLPVPSLMPKLPSAPPPATPSGDKLLDEGRHLFDVSLPISVNRFPVTIEEGKEITTETGPRSNRQTVCANDPCGAEVACHPTGDTFQCLCSDGTVVVPMQSCPQIKPGIINIMIWSYQIAYFCILIAVNVTPPAVSMPQANETLSTPSQVCTVDALKNQMANERSQTQSFFIARITYGSRSVPLCGDWLSSACVLA